jgi:hypothetical protein
LLKFPSARCSLAKLFQWTGRAPVAALSLSLAACTGLNLAPSEGGRGCNVGGANDQVKSPGNQAGGVALAYGDLAVAPDGSFVVYDRAGSLAVAWVKTGRVEALPVEEPSRLAFAAGRHVVYVSSTKDGAVHAIDVDAGVTLWSTPLGEFLDGFLVVSASDARIAFAATDRLWILDAEDGHVVHDAALDTPPVDLEILPDDERVLAVERHTFPNDASPGAGGAAATTRLRILDMALGDVRTVIVPNCSDDVVVTGDGKTALLAPTSCSKDPISVIELTPGKEAFRKNLPGFGPVVLAPDGVTAVGFLERANADASLVEAPNTLPKGGAFHLMVLDTQALSYVFYEYGDALPRYALAPDGKLLLVDDVVSGKPGRLFDMEKRAFEALVGPKIHFDQLALSRDASHAYVLSDAALGRRGRPRGRGRRPGTEWSFDYGLFELDLASAEVASVPLDFRPQNVNIAPDDASLFLRRSPHRICVYSLEMRSCERELDLAVLE